VPRALAYDGGGLQALKSKPSGGRQNRRRNSRLESENGTHFGCSRAECLRLEAPGRGPVKQVMSCGLRSTLWRELRPSQCKKYEHCCKSCRPITKKTMRGFMRELEAGWGE
jgi:hypothetical protein